MKANTRRLRAACTATLAALLLAPATAMAAPPPPPVDETGPVQPYIVGGNDASEDYGFVVSLQLPLDDGRLAPFCTGSLITPTRIITAGHCAAPDRLIVGKTKVHVGANDNTVGGEHLTTVAEIKVHPGFDQAKSYDDLAMVKLDRAVPFTPVMLGGNSGRVGSLNRIMGWGVVCDRDLINDPQCQRSAPKILQELDTTRLPDERCKPWFDAKRNLCIGSADGQKKQACFGDSGGPLVKKVGKRYDHGKWKNRWVLIGATTGDGDDEYMRPYVCTTAPNGGPGAGVWQDLTQYRSWIVKTLLDIDRYEAAQFQQQSAEADQLMAAA